MFAKKHYEAIAQVARYRKNYFAETGDGPDFTDDFIRDLAEMFLQDDANFDEQRFYQACGL